MKITDIRIAGLSAPLGIDETSPVISWKIRPEGEEDYSDLYQKSASVKITEAGSADAAADSGMIDTRDQKMRLEVPGIKPHTEYSVDITVTLSDGSVLNGYSRWETGFLGTPWQAKWIGPDREMRQTVDLMAFMATMNPYAEDKTIPPDSLRDLYPAVHFNKKYKTRDCGISSAKLYATAHGAYEFLINGTKAGDQELAPEFTTYPYMLQYQTFDITDALNEHRGQELSLTAVLADGYYIGRIGMIGIGYEYGEHTGLMAQIEVTYEDGRKDVFGTDDTWLYGDTDICYSDIFIGEKRDLTTGWAPAVSKPVIREYENSVLTGQTAEPLRVLERIPAAEIITTPAGETVIDFGQVVAGVPEITFRGKRGEEVILEHQETLDENGNFFFNIPRFNCEMQDIYILEEGEQTLRPHFTIHGFRYVRVSGYSGDLRAEDCIALVIGSDCRDTGEFSCSDERLNILQKNIKRSQVSNFISIPTDCPQRERAGWTGDIQIYGPTAAYNADVLAFLKRWLTQVRADQLPDGQIPVVVPYTPGYQNMQHAIGGDSSAGWGDVIVGLPYTLYRAYGDISVLEDNFEAMERWMAYVADAASKLPENIGELTEEQKAHWEVLWTEGFHYGDWLYPSAVDKDGNSDAFQSAEKTRSAAAMTMYAMSARTMISVCKALGVADRESYYTDLYRRIKEAYGAECVSSEGLLAQDLQGIYTLALAMDLIPEDRKAAAAQHLAELIHGFGDRMDAGFLSIPFFLDVLWENGYPELAWKLLFSEQYPSWLYEVKMGATSMWESWDAIRPDGKPNVTSFNHYAFGCVGDFMYRRILGLNIEEPGYRKFSVKPDLSCGLEYARGGLDTVYGRINVAWNNTDAGKWIEVDVPVNTEAEIQFGCGAGAVTHRCVSGHYRFTAE